MTAGTGGHQDQSNGTARSAPACYATSAHPSVLAPVGLVRDAKVMTARGLRPVQDITNGEPVITRGNGVVHVVRIEQQSLVARAVYVIGGSIGHGQPDRDTMLPAGQCVLLQDWRSLAFSGEPQYLVRADRLVDGEFVRDIGLQPMTLYRIYCTVPQVLYADGMLLGTSDSVPGSFAPGIPNKFR